MRKLAAMLLLLSGCAAVKADSKLFVNELKADMSACGSVAVEDVHELLPLLADYGICMAFNQADTGKCSAQAQSLSSTGKDKAIQCGLAMIQKADQDATSAAKDAGSN